MPSSIIRSDSEGIELIRELARSYWYSAVLRAGIKLGAFSLLDGGPLTPTEMARELPGDLSFVRAFLDACEVLGLVEKHSNLYAQTVPWRLLSWCQAGNNTLEATPCSTRMPGHPGAV